MTEYQCWCSHNNVANLALCSIAILMHGKECHGHTSAHTHTCLLVTRWVSEKSWSCINFVASLKYFKSDTHMPYRVDVDVDGCDIVHRSLFMRKFFSPTKWNAWNRFTNHLIFNRFHEDKHQTPIFLCTWYYQTNLVTNLSLVRPAGRKIESFDGQWAFNAGSIKQP